MGNFIPLCRKEFTGFWILDTGYLMLLRISDRIHRIDKIKIDM